MVKMFLLKSARITPKFGVYTFATYKQKLKNNVEYLTALLPNMTSEEESSRTVLDQNTPNSYKQNNYIAVLFFGQAVIVEI